MPRPCNHVLEQAALASPIFGTRWRWDANRALALLRFQGGKKVPPQIQRMRSDDLLASVFPDVAACQENIEGDIKIPDHPLVQEVMKDVLTEAMDIDGLKDLLRGIDRWQHPLRGRRYAGAVAVLARNTECESVRVSRRCSAGRAARPRRRDAAHAAGVGSGRSRQTRSGAIAQVREEAWPDVRDADELHDVLHTLIALPVSHCGNSRRRPHSAKLTHPAH